MADLVETQRLRLSPQISPNRKSELGQFFTPARLAKLIITKYHTVSGHVRLLDPGAGLGALTAAFVDRILKKPEGVVSCELTAYELDRGLVPGLESTLSACCNAMNRRGIHTDFKVVAGSFVDTAETVQPSLFGHEWQGYTHAVLNPPYRKINTDSEVRRTLAKAGIETSNLYSAFVWLALLQLTSGGELVAITPRSFCNGSYFRPFRLALLSNASLESIHVFESRADAFADDEVLQENVIVHLRRAVAQAPRVSVVQSHGGYDETTEQRELPFQEVVDPSDPQHYIHIVADELGVAIKREMTALPATLQQLGLAVSTGPVVDFRLKQWLRRDVGPGVAPLIYPEALHDGHVAWPPPNARKPIGIVQAKETQQWLTPPGWYVVTRRFSSKEENRRVIAAVCPPLPFAACGIENHLNYFHANGKGLEQVFARGLAAFLNSSLFDLYFRQFSGHTQVNATDLRGMRYPRRETLLAIGNCIPDEPLEQQMLDTIVNEALQVMDDTTLAFNASTRIKEALDILKQVSAPRAQQNERSALTLLALADITSDRVWSDAKAECRGITELMDWFRLQYGRNYAPNTRETVRRQTMHQFVQMGLATENPDSGERPVNSPKYCYQLTSEALALVKSYGTALWDAELRRYLADVPNRLIEANRAFEMIPAVAPDGSTLLLTKGGQNPLIALVIEEFCKRFTPGAEVLYAGDAGEKFNPLGIAKLEQRGIVLDIHGKMPDVIVDYKEKGWLVLVEATTSHGPISLKRRNELEDLFSGYCQGIVFVTAFLTRRDMTRYLGDIAWETEVWVAESPDHLIHFNGKRFLGPYEDVP